MARGIDLVELFENLSADRCLNLIEEIIVEELIRNGKVDGAIKKLRSEITRIYLKAEKNEEPIEFVETPQTEQGYVGLDAPLN